MWNAIRTHVNGSESDIVILQIEYQSKKQTLIKQKKR